MDRVTGQEVEFHLGILHARQDGQAIVWVAVTMLLIVALFVAGVGIAQLMLFRWDAQGAADAAALAGANIQAQAIMSLAFLDALIYARNAVLSGMYAGAAVLGAICAACIIGIGCWACPLAAKLSAAAIDFKVATEKAVKAIMAFQKVIKIVFPFYASANATWYGWKNGALAIGVPLPFIQPGEGGEENGGSSSGTDLDELGQQITDINNCLDLLKFSKDEGVFYIPDDIRHSLEQLKQAYSDNDVPAMQAELRYLLNSDLRSRMDRIIKAIERMEAGANQCNLAKVDEIMARGLQCKAPVTCDGKTETRCTRHSAPGRAGFHQTLRNLRQDAQEIQEWLDRIDDCLADKNNKGCTRQIANGLRDAFEHLDRRAQSIQVDFLKARADKLEKCMDCVGKATMEANRCHLEEIDKESDKLLGLNGMFVLVWRRNTSGSGGAFDTDSRLWRDSQSVGTVYSAAFGTPSRVENSDGECNRCLFQSVDIGPLKEIPLLKDVIDAAILLFNVLLGKGSCERPDWAKSRVFSGVLDGIADLIAWITEIFAGQQRPDVCERRPILTRVDAGLAVGLGLTTSRSNLTNYVLDLVDKYNEVARRWNGVPKGLADLPIWDFFPDVRDILGGLRLPIIDRPNLTGPLF